MQNKVLSKVAYSFMGSHDECEDWLLNMGFINERGKLIHPRFRYEMSGGFNGKCVVQIYKK